jgi:2-dehydropantoate 2-reductase
VRVAVLGPGGVGGLVAGALARAGTDVTVVAREGTAAAIASGGLHIESVRLGRFTVHPPAVAELEVPVDVLIVAVKAPQLDASLGRIRGEPRLVVPLLNGFEHLAVLRERFGAARVPAGAIRIVAQRTAPGHVAHTSANFRIELAPPDPDVSALAHVLRAAELPTAVRSSEAEVLWSKLCRLNALALTTGASGLTIGEVRGHPRWRLLLEGAVDETAAVARAEGAAIDDHVVLEDLAELSADARSSLALDVEAGGETELDAIGGAVLRAAARHGLAAPTVAELVRLVAERLRSRQA